jgi:biotin transporter BioY
MTNKQIVIWNLVAFAFIHLILEVALNMGSEIKTNAAAPVLIQYLISYWIISSKVEKKDKKSLIRYTWIVSLSVLAIRIVLGFVFFGAMMLAN